MNAQDLIDVLSQWKLSAHTERAMQDDIEVILTQSSIESQREFSLSKRDRLDFMVGSTAVECKIASGKTEVLRQLQRYAEDDRVAEILLVTTRQCHRSIDGLTLQGKPVRVHWVFSV